MRLVAELAELAVRADPEVDWSSGGHHTGVHSHTQVAVHMAAGHKVAEVVRFQPVQGGAVLSRQQVVDHRGFEAPSLIDR